MVAKRHLGRGLSALLGEEEGPAPAPDRAGDRQFVVPIDRLRPGKFQPRVDFDQERLEQLAQSIREQGVLQPILVRPIVGEAGFEIVAGERRWRAAQMARLHQVPVVLREIADKQALEIALVENLQRQDLNPIEEAMAYRYLQQQFGHSQEALARHIGKSRPHIANTLRLLELPKPVRQMIVEGRLSAGQARPLIGNPDAALLAEKIVKGGLSARAAEALARAPRRGKSGISTTDTLPRKKDADTRSLENDLTLRLGLKVEIEFDGKAGRLVLHYKSLDQLDDLVRKLSA
jgi:ParB family chromosome partitioning protein